MATATATATVTTFASLLEIPEVSQAQLAAHLDGLSAEERVTQARQLSGKAQRVLWKVCAGAPAFTLEDLVPSSLGDGKMVIYAGKNSLPTFSTFEKRFIRASGKVLGFNFQTMSFVTGPGYFTTVQSPNDAREILFDYTQTPSEKPPGDGSAWPAPRPNTGLLSRMVYGGMHDFCRRVSKDVIIGSAFRNGKDIDSYFVLARR
jgi:hypothetical protein